MLKIEQPIETGDPAFLSGFQLDRKQLSRHPGIAESAMAAFERESEVLRQHIESPPPKRRPDSAREPQRTYHVVLETHAEQAPKFEIEETEIELSVVGDQHRIAQKIAEARQYFLDRRCGLYCWIDWPDRPLGQVDVISVEFQTSDKVGPALIKPVPGGNG